MFVRKVVPLMLCILLWLLPLSGCGAEEVVSITEDGFTTRFNPNTGTLTVSGEGVLSDLYPRKWEDDGERTIWSNAINEDQTVKVLVVKEGITKLDNCFNDLLALKRIKLPSTLEVIKKSFIHCESLEKLNIPTSVGSIQDFSFDNCISLSNIKFHGKIEFGHSDRYMITTVFSNLESLESISIPDNSILCRAFNECPNLKSITIGKLVSCHEIYADGFISCSHSFQLTDLSDLDRPWVEDLTAMKERVYYVHKPVKTGMSSIEEGVCGLRHWDQVKKVHYLK